MKLMAQAIRSSGEVAERSIAADCKSAVLVATEVRTLPSPPTFLRERAEGWRTGKKIDGEGLPSGERLSDE
jgi:hypothetical protein